VTQRGNADHLSVERTALVFARAPRRGSVKTRLASSVGDDVALEIYRQLGSATIATLRGVGDCAVVVYHTPDDAAGVVGDWLGNDVALRPQGDGDLGERLQRAIEQTLHGLTHRMIVVGTDCPELTTDIIESAFASLSSHDVVIGPTMDGGYYLIGMSEPHSCLFEDVPWSTTETFAATCAAARRHGLRVAELPSLRDIDTADDWRSWLAATYPR
jgi:rSAM/selenodomain-associated transferase 1